MSEGIFSLNNTSNDYKNLYFWDKNSNSSTTENINAASIFTDKDLSEYTSDKLENENPYSLYNIDINEDDLLDIDESNKTESNKTESNKTENSNKTKETNKTENNIYNPLNLDLNNPSVEKDEKTGLIKSSKDENGNKIVYQYDSNNKLIGCKKYLGDSEDENNLMNECTYNDDFQIATKHELISEETGTRGDFFHTYTYDDKGRATNAKVYSGNSASGNPIGDYEYSYNGDSSEVVSRTNKATNITESYNYENGKRVSTNYKDKDGNILSTYKYNSDGTIASIDENGSRTLFEYENGLRTKSTKFDVNENDEIKNISATSTYKDGNLRSIEKGEYTYVYENNSSSPKVYKTTDCRNGEPIQGKQPVSTGLSNINNPLGSTANGTSNTIPSGTFKGTLEGKEALVESICNQYGVDPILVSAIIGCESGYGTSELAQSNNFMGLRTAGDAGVSERGFGYFSTAEKGLEAAISNLAGYTQYGIDSIDYNHIDEIGAIYCEGGDWAGQIKTLYNEIKSKQTTSNTQDGNILNNYGVTGGADVSQAVDWAKQYEGMSEGEMAGVFAQYNQQFDPGAWCADFVRMSLQESVGEENLPDWYNNIENKAYCPDIYAAGEGHQVSPESAKTGDIVLFDWDGDGVSDHVGLFIDNGNGSSNITTIEGNTSNQVAQKNRDRNTVMGIYSIH